MMKGNKSMVKVCIIRPGKATKEFSVTRKQVAVAGVSVVSSLVVGGLAGSVIKDFLLFHQPAVQGFMYLG